MIRRSLWVAAVTLSLVGSARALDPRTGGTTFLETADARLTALGEAGAALTGDSASGTGPGMCRWCPFPRRKWTW